MTHETPGQPVTAAPAAPRPFYKKKRFAIPAGIVLLGILLGSCAGGGADDAAPGTAAAPAASAEAAAQPAAAPSSAAPAPAAPAAPAVGKPFTVEMRNGDVARITILSAVRAESVSASMHTPADNGSYLLLDVLWETEKGKTASNPLYFSAKDASGRKADLNMFADNQLASGDVLPGDKSRGFIAFDAPAGPVTVMISDPLLQEAARIQIPG